MVQVNKTCIQEHRGKAG